MERNLMFDFFNFCVFKIFFTVNLWSSNRFEISFTPTLMSVNAHIFNFWLKLGEL